MAWCRLAGIVCTRMGCGVVGWDRVGCGIGLDQIEKKRAGREGRQWERRAAMHGIETNGLGVSGSGGMGLVKLTQQYGWNSGGRGVSQWSGVGCSCPNELTAQLGAARIWVEAPTACEAAVSVDDTADVKGKGVGTQRASERV